MRSFRERDDALVVTANQRQGSRCRRTEDGAGLVEYVLLVALIAIVCMVGVAYFGGSVNGRFSAVGSTIALLTRMG